MKTFLLTFMFLVSGCISAQVEVPSVCATRTVNFPAAPIVPLGVVLAPVTASFTVDTGVASDWLSDVKFINGTLTLTSGGSFGFLDELMVSVADPAGGDDLVLWDVQKPNTDTDTLNVLGSDNNLLNYIDDDNYMTINITVSTQTPSSTAWDVDVNLCVSAAAERQFP